MSNENDAYGKTEIPANFPAEDLVLKSAMQFFKDELLSYLGITAEPVTIGPTEFVHLEAKHLYEDFNFIKPDRSWIHLEFESDLITLEDLRRFREYEASTSRTHRVAVVTYVICSSRVTEPVTELAEGINVYRVRVIRMRSRDGDKVFAGLEEKRRNGGKVQKAELVPLLLTPLMSSRLSVRERIVKSLEILQEEEAAVTGLEMEKMQAVLYTFADKFLSAGDLEQVKEMIAMTRLGQMLVEDGIARGIEQGIEQGIALTKRVLRLSAKGFTRDQIAEDCGIGRKEVDDILREEEDL